MYVMYYISLSMNISYLINIHIVIYVRTYVSMLLYTQLHKLHNVLITIHCVTGKFNERKCWQIYCNTSLIREKLANFY